MSKVVDGHDLICGGGIVKWAGDCWTNESKGNLTLSLYSLPSLSSWLLNKIHASPIFIAARLVYIWVWESILESAFVNCQSLSSFLKTSILRNCTLTLILISLIPKTFMTTIYISLFYQNYSKKLQQWQASRHFITNWNTQHLPSCALTQLIKSYYSYRYITWLIICCFTINENNQVSLERIIEECVIPFPWSIFNLFLFSLSAMAKTILHARLPWSTVSCAELLLADYWGNFLYSNTYLND